MERGGSDGRVVEGGDGHPEHLLLEDPGPEGVGDGFVEDAHFGGGVVVMAAIVDGVGMFWRTIWSKIELGDVGD
jgi:hypothetical protein